jgi:hypothetical protein
MAKLVKLVFNATGVQYNIAQNGYVKFGDLFGGLIIQWGIYNAMPIDATTRKIAFNISMTLICGTVTPNCYDIPNIIISPYIANADSSGIYVLIDYEIGQGYTPGSATSNILWMALGK